MIQEYTLSLWRRSLATGANMQGADQITEIKKYNLKMTAEPNQHLSKYTKKLYLGRRNGLYLILQIHVHLITSVKSVSIKHKATLFRIDSCLLFRLHPWESISFFLNVHLKVGYVTEHLSKHHKNGIFMLLMQINWKEFHGWLAKPQISFQT